MGTTRSVLDTSVPGGSAVNGLRSRAGVYELAVEIGGLAVLLRTSDASFRDLLGDRYGGFLNPSIQPRCEFDVELIESPKSGADEVQVQNDGGLWSLRRGDFCAEFNPDAGKGWIRQTANHYSTDTLLRIVHSLVLAREGGFLLHSASAIRNGRASLFCGVSGAGKTTISRLAPADVTLLTDEVSYVRRIDNTYYACGTPFAGELARVGENCSAPIAGFFFLEKGPGNRIEPIDTAVAVRSLLRNILFFAEDSELVRLLFRSAFEFVERVPVRRLTFFPDQRVWDLIE